MCIQDKKREVSGCLKSTNPWGERSAYDRCKITNLMNPKTKIAKSILPIINKNDEAEAA
jgi:hypothetical protein